MFEYLNQSALKQLSSEIEQTNYNEKDLREVKFRLNLPYYNLQSEYEPFEGEVVIQGNHYIYVKRKVMQDTLFLLCLPNEQKDKLAAAKTDYEKTVTDTGGEKQKEGTAKKENSFTKYQYHNLSYLFTTPQAIIKKQRQPFCLFVPESFITMHDIPPEFYS